MRKNKVISIRVTEQEYEELSKKAGSKGKNVSDYVRDELFSTKIPFEFFGPARPIVTTTATAPAYTTYWYNTTGGVNT